MYDSIDEAAVDSEMIIVGNNNKYYIDFLSHYKGIIFDLARLDESLISKENYFGINW